MMVGRWVSFWDCLCLGAMLNFRGVPLKTCSSLQPRIVFQASIFRGELLVSGGYTRDMNIATPEWSSQDLVLIPQSVSKVNWKNPSPGKVITVLIHKDLSRNHWVVKSQISRHMHGTGIYFLSLFVILLKVMFCYFPFMVIFQIIGFLRGRGDSPNLP